MRRTRLIGTVFVWLFASEALAQDAGRPECSPGNEFCIPLPPCYREPDNPDCNPDCNCTSPNYPECDPYCAPGDICDTNCANPCWDEFERDICSDPPPPCEPTGELPFTFVDDRDGSDDGQIWARGDGERPRSCGTVRVDRTAYYAIYDTELSESCDDQLDETGYLTIHNRCNPDGWAVERNAGDRFLVFDSDNSLDCTGDSECGAGRVCRESNGHGRCCVPDAPVFMGTFLLVEGVDNEICINHWCPEWRTEIEAGNDFGFVEAGCEGSPNSIHFEIDTHAIACEDELHLQPCSWGCGEEGCLPDPCDSVSCPAYCKDGVCLDENPCAGLACEHGCVRGRCLQNRHARGPDEDMDGYSRLADCDDSDPTAHPGRPEVCDDGEDDDCDGFVDESDCESGGVIRDGGLGGDSGLDAGAEEGPDGGTSGVEDGGCGCRAVAHEALPTRSLAVLIACSVPLLLRRRRARKRAARPRASHGARSADPDTTAQPPPAGSRGERGGGWQTAGSTPSPRTHTNGDGHARSGSQGRVHVP